MNDLTAQEHELAVHAMKLKMLLFLFAAFAAISISAPALSQAQDSLDELFEDGKAALSADRTMAT